MSFPPDPSSLVRAVGRHVRNSHAIGKLVVDTVVGRLTKATPPKSQGAAPKDAPTPADAPGPVTGLPLPENEWALLSSGDVVDMIDRCDDAAVRAIAEFEENHRRRRLVMQAVKRRIGA